MQDSAGYTITTYFPQSFMDLQLFESHFEDQMPFVNWISQHCDFLTVLKKTVLKIASANTAVSLKRSY